MLNANVTPVTTQSDRPELPRLKYQAGEFVLPPDYYANFARYKAMMKQLLSDLKDSLEGYPVTKLTRDMANSVMQDGFNELRANEDLTIELGLKFAGVHVDIVEEENTTGLRFKSDEGVTTKLNLTLKLDFFPKSNHRRHPGQALPLGWWGEFDLYLAFQDKLPPTLVARHGDAGDEYYSLNPSLAAIQRGNPVHAPFVEGYRRAVKLGLMEQQPIQRNEDLLADAGSRPGTRIMR